ncbi:MAG: recombinase RecT [Pseudomonadota bacterium]
MNQVATKPRQSPLDRFKQKVDLAAPSIEQVLPRHVDMDRFKRILLSAVGHNDDLKRAAAENPQSILTSALACAKDGLIPDGREAALVVFNTKTKGKSGERDRWVATAQYMPMIGGVLKMMRQSGEVQTLSAHVVHDRDEFDYQLGDDERIHHKPALVDDRGKMIAAYAVLKTKDGGVYREIMGRDQIMAVKGISKTASKGPWSGPFEGEMWKKTVLRRLAKRAPLSTDVIDLIQRDDNMYELPDMKALEPAAPRVLDMSTGEISGGTQQLEMDPEPEPQAELEAKGDVLDGDDLPDEVKGGPERPQEKAAVPDTTSEPEDETHPKAEPESEPETKTEDLNDDEPYTKASALAALGKAESVEQIDEILSAAWSCASWVDVKGVKTTLSMKADDRRKALEAEAD